MDIEAKLRILAGAARYDVSCASSGSPRTGAPAGICHSYTPDGRCISLLKVLLTNSCIFDCAYCVNRASSDVPRTRLTSAEITGLTVDFWRRNYIEGLFLSSGVIRTPDYTMEQMAAAARSLRVDHRFRGYIHLKAVPGASPGTVAEAGRWADRMSANIELPAQADLDRLAPAKKQAEIEGAMGRIRDGILDAKDRTGRHGGRPYFAPAGQSTQFVVGATASSDAEILAKSSALYQAYGLKRVYYSAYNPVPHAGPALPGSPPPLAREHRLYQADWLMRFYGFDAAELTTADEPDLPAACDPKLAWALRHREFFPVDVNRAAKTALLRVPGLGVRNVQRITSIRRHHRLSLADLAKLRIPLRRAAHFLVTADSSPALLDSARLPEAVACRQLSLFEVRTGEF
jgi:putative DNA modification/repair radical SAM protein